VPLNIFSAFQKIGIGLLDTLFPISCLGCHAPQKFLCEDCLNLFPRRLRQRCPTCLKATTPRGEVCFACLGKNSLDGLFAASHYRHPLVAESVHTYKYRFIPAFAKPLGVWLALIITENDLPLPDIFIPIPLHSRRLRFRGFNQSELLADALSEALTPGFPLPVWKNCLLRARYTKPQMKTTSREERLGNLKDAFVIAKENKKLVKGKNVWLVDDVATTGITLEECAHVLKKSGAKNVFGIVLAR
jgi:ComF family protein